MAAERKIITDKLVVEKTGRTLEEWFSILDKKGAKKMQHKEIFALVGSIDGLAPLGEWNQNLLTTTYEWNRGLKERGEKEGGIEVGVSKTINVGLPVLYNAWIDDDMRGRWMPKQKIIFRKTTANKSARITWSDNSTSVSVDFYAKGKDKSQVVVQHQKLPGADDADAMKTYWGERLQALKELLE